MAGEAELALVKAICAKQEHAAIWVGSFLLQCPYDSSITILGV